MSIETITFSDGASQRTDYEIPESKRIAGNPPQTIEMVYDQSPAFSMGYWASGVGKWQVHYTEHEYCEMLEGVSVVVDTNGHQRVLKKGDRFVIPAGFVGTWEVVEPTRKLFVVHEGKV